MRILASVALAALIAGCSAQEDAAAPAEPILADAEDCSRVTGEMLGAADASSEWVEAAEGLPAYCEVTATLTPAEGSNIGVVYRLPAEVLRETTTGITMLLARGDLKHPEVVVHPLEEIVDAHERVERGADAKVLVRL